MTNASERGVSVEIAERFPYLTIIHMCLSVAAYCDLRKGNDDKEQKTAYRLEKQGLNQIMSLTNI